MAYQSIAQTGSELSKMLTKAITYMGQPTLMGCDGQCNKAWGQHGRPCTIDRQLYLADHELDIAPAHPGSEEGRDIKPSAVPLSAKEAASMNKWCVRECERSSLCSLGSQLVLPNLNVRTQSIYVE